MVIDTPILHSSIKAVFFDVGGTLIHPRHSVGYIYSRIAETYGMVFKAEDADKSFKDAFLAHHDTPLNSTETEKLWWQQIVKDTIHPLTRIINFNYYFNHLWLYFSLAEAWEIFPNVFSILTKCKSLNLNLGIVSNWDSRLKPLLKKLTLDVFFDTITVSALEGAAKPDRKIFLRALSSVGVAPEEVIHVGDSVHYDGLGAENAGIFPVIIDRNETKHSKYKTIRTLLELF